jgi:hypothetical protein
MAQTSSVAPASSRRRKRSGLLRSKTQSRFRQRRIAPGFTGPSPGSSCSKYGHAFSGNIGLGFQETEPLSALEMVFTLSRSYCFWVSPKGFRECLFGLSSLPFLFFELLETSLDLLDFFGVGQQIICAQGHHLGRHYCPFPAFFRSCSLSEGV